ncbi:ABC transporter permease [Egibacter rhizosphaerae]|uniref:Transport permease protein n=1 Tax=Egibacter rhizosphaerae TaxID=1670831 RepID=A0A411YKE4_9ACTN|nr:ABC transporter permease [Egibacter rhizosphaerae]QBI21650.1 ABC transporter permease [Egibacter rhizosphaerae]
MTSTEDPAAGPASPVARVRAQAALELRLLARNGENALVTAVIPTAVLVFFVLVPVVPVAPGPDARVDALAPGVLAIAAMGSAMVALGISTAFERDHGVLARLGTTPLRRSELLAAKALAVLAIQGAQVVLLVGAAVALGWRPTPTVGAALAAVGGWVVGTGAFAGLGLLAAGRLPALRALALINLVFLALLLLGGVVIPPPSLPAPLAAFSATLPTAALAGVLRATAQGAVAWGALGILAVWALAAIASASTLFRWDERP